VALEATFRELFIQLRQLNDTLLALRLTVGEDKPLKGEAALVDHFEDAVLDLMGLLDECLKATRVAQKAVGHPVDLDGARRALAKCQECFHRIERQFSADLVSYEKLKDLASLGSERRGEWLPWAGSVKHGLEQCQQPLNGASKALAACWQEIAEHVGMTSISVQSINIGQKIVTKASEVEELARNEVT
jgi:hypothetical protein